jgi:hypothetical protein
MDERAGRKQDQSVKYKTIAIYLTMIGLLFALAIGWYIFAFLTQPEPVPILFDGQRAYADVETQVAFGPRIPGSDGHAKTQAWMQDELVKAGWQVEVQESEAMGHLIQNIVTKRSDESPQVILGAHYDTRMFANNDPDPAKPRLILPIFRIFARQPYPSQNQFSLGCFYPELREDFFHQPPRRITIGWMAKIPNKTTHIEMLE